MADTVLEFPRRKNPRSASLIGTGFGLYGTSAPDPETAADPAYSSDSSHALSIEIDKLYPSEPNSKILVIAALGLLADAISYVEKARVDARAQRLIDADRHTQRFEALLIPLFAQRAIGDGFASAINSLHFAMVNQHGHPLNFDQLTTVWRVLRELRNTPFISFDKSIEWVSEIEECNRHLQSSHLVRLVVNKSRGTDSKDYYY